MALFRSKKNRQSKTNSDWLSFEVEKEMSFSKFPKEETGFFNSLNVPILTQKTYLWICLVLGLWIVIYYLFAFSCLESNETSFSVIPNQATEDFSMGVSGLEFQSRLASTCNSKIISTLFDWKPRTIFFTNQIGVHIGIGSIIVALLIFIAESMREGSMLRARVLIRESKVFRLILLEITSLAFLPYLEWLPFVADIVILSVGITALLSIAKTIRIFYDKRHYLKVREDYCISLLRLIIADSARERLGNNILRKREKELGVTFTYPGWIDDPSQYYHFVPKHQGVIEDINLTNLAQLITQIRRPQAIQSSEQSATTNAQMGQKEGKIYLTRAYKDRISSEKNENQMLYIEKSFIDDLPTEERQNMIDFINNAVQSNGFIFEVKPKENFQESLQDIFSELKDNTVKAIRDYQLGEVENLTELYLAITDSFMKSLEDLFGRGYPYDAASKERRQILGGWTTISGLKRDTYWLAEQAFRTEDRDIISQVVYLPVQIAKNAIEKKDHYLFQEFIDLSLHLYWASKEQTNNKLKEFTFDRSWRYVKEVCEYFVVPRLRKESSDIDEYKHFAIYFLIIFQRLIKATIDSKDQPSFRVYLDATLDLFDHLDFQRLDHEIKNLEFRLQRVKLSDAQKEELQRELERLNIHQEIKMKRKVMLFGLCADVLSKWERSHANVHLEMSKSLMKGFTGMSLKDLSEVFLDAHNFEEEDFWGWTWWETVPDGKVRAVNFGGKIISLYVLLVLKRMASSSADALPSEVQDALTVVNVRGFAHLCGENQEFFNILKSMLDAPQRYAPILTTDELTMASDKAKDFFSKAKTAADQREKEEIRKTPAASSKIEGFKQEVIKAFKEKATFREIMSDLKLFVEQLKERPKDKPENRFGINVVSDKAAFFEEWHTHYMDWGSSYGDEMGTGENTELLRLIVERCEKRKVKDIDQCINEIGDPKDVIIIATNYSLYDFLEGNEKYQPAWNLKEKPALSAFAGFYTYQKHVIPIFNIFTRLPFDEVLVLNVKKLGKLVQYSPKAEQEPPSNIVDIFYMEIRSFSENNDLMDEFLQKPPKWLVDISPETEGQRQHLLERMLIKIYERFRIEFKEDFKGFRLSDGDDTSV